MGYAAYERGSRVIGVQIGRDFDVERKRLRENIVNAEKRIDELEQFCRLAQSLYVDASDPETAKGLLRSHMHWSTGRAKNSRRLRALQEELVEAHCDWVNSDRQQSLIHVRVCRRKAVAYRTVLVLLAGPYRLPFSVPRSL